MKKDPKKFFNFVDMKKNVWDTLQVCILLVSLRWVRRILATFLHIPFCPTFLHSRAGFIVFQGWGC
jgi:hypothetical protein